MVVTPKVYVEHAKRGNKETQWNQGADPTSPYYCTDLLNRYAPWVWVDGPGALPPQRHQKFYNILAVNDTPFTEFATEKYGVIKGFARTGRWKDSNGDGFLAWYTESAIDSIEKERGLALVYTHLDRKWIDPETRQIREPIRQRLKYLSSKNGWLVPPFTHKSKLKKKLTRKCLFLCKVRPAWRYCPIFVTI